MNDEKTLAAGVSFWTAFFNSIAMITVTELGDKTFFIAAVLAMVSKRIFFKFLLSIIHSDTHELWYI